MPLDLSWFKSPEDGSELERLDAEISRLERKAMTSQGFEELLGVFERFPEHDGLGVFWSIVHFLESCEGYEIVLVESVKRKPVEFNVMMINRLLNAGITTVNGQPLMALLRQIATGELAQEGVKKIVLGFINHQRSNGRAEA